MDDVARVANVSISTVSHVINSTRKVHADTLLKVHNAIAALGYIPNTLARSLARSSSSTIGVAIPALSNHYFGESFQAIEAQCAQHGLMMLLADTRDDPDHEINTLRALHQRRVDGILLVPSVDPHHRALNYLKSNRVPTVLIDRMHDESFDQIGVENTHSTQVLIHHLIEHGHSRIGMVSGLAGISTTDERIEGYRQALEAANLPFDDSLIQSGFSRTDLAQTATLRLLDLPQPPTAIMSGNNMMSVGVLRALKERHLRSPQDIALVGFDDFDWVEFFNPGITVQSQPLDELGRLAVKLLCERIETPAMDRRRIQLAPRLQIRTSCGCGLGASTPGNSSVSPQTRTSVEPA